MRPAGGPQILDLNRQSLAGLMSIEWPSLAEIKHDLPETVTFWNSSESVTGCGQRNKCLYAISAR